jgi:3-deoxy-manno-octulosonate cytidylyltransferase (CMP-KDO synthetase)
MGSSRLPGKPLAEIGGAPMIVQVLRRARAAALGPVVVACGEAEIAAAVTAEGGKAIMTAADLPSGSDRVAAALAVVDPARRHDIIINLQGDLPGFEPDGLRQLCAVLEDPAYDIATLVAPVESAGEAAAPSVVKAVCAFAPGAAAAPALYFSRNIVPHGPGPVWHHVGVYAYRRAALARFVALPPSPLELRETLEQLRALEAGMRIGCAAIARAPLGVDTPEDLARMRQEFAGRDGDNA